MDNTFIDDIKELLDKEKGDKRILEQILRASENNEVISNYERNYVTKLSEKYLDKKPPIEEKPTPPDVNLLEEQPVQNQESLIQESKPTISKKSKHQTMYVGIGIAALAIIVISAIALSGMPDLTSNTTQNDSSSTGISLQTDLSSYSRGDIISINGKSDASLGQQISLSIENQNGQLAWSETVNIKSDGQFSTLLIAGGDEWNAAGTFTLIATHGAKSETTTFSFTN